MIDGAPHEYKEKPGACPDCGNSPVNHFEHYISNTLAVWSAHALAERKGMHASVVRGLGSLFDILEQSLQRAISALPFARFSQDVTKASTYRSQVIWEEAVRRGIEMEQLCLFGKATEIYRAKIDGVWHYFQSLPIPRALRGDGVGWMDDKLLLKHALSRAGVAAPRNRSVTSIEEGLRAVDELGGAVVIKPRSGSRGRHTSVNVKERADAETALRSAQKLCRYVVVEEYLKGPVCRGTVVNGRLAGFFRADPPKIRGDGRARVRDLIAQQNQSKPERVQDIVLTDEHLRFLARNGLSIDSIVPAGSEVPLTHRTGRLFGGTTRELLGSEHQKLRAYLERAAAALDVAVVGFDLIIEDPERDPDEQKWGIIEANSLPYIDLHYLALEGAPSNVAAQIWDLWSVAMHTGSVDGYPLRATMKA